MFLEAHIFGARFADRSTEPSSYWNTGAANVALTAGLKAGVCLASSEAEDTLTEITV